MLRHAVPTSGTVCSQATSPNGASCRQRLSVPTPASLLATIWSQSGRSFRSWPARGQENPETPEVRCSRVHIRQMQTWQPCRALQGLPVVPLTAKAANRAQKVSWKRVYIGVSCPHAGRSGIASGTELARTVFYTRQTGQHCCAAWCSSDRLNVLSVWALRQLDLVPCQESLPLRRSVDWQNDTLRRVLAYYYQVHPSRSSDTCASQSMRSL